MKRPTATFDYTTNKGSQISAIIVRYEYCHAEVNPIEVTKLSPFQSCLNVYIHLTCFEKIWQPQLYGKVPPPLLACEDWHVTLAQ